LEDKKMETEYKGITGTDDYRTRLDILENMAYRLKEYGDTATRPELDEIAHEVADEWPHIAYNGRLIQWLQAGSPDLDELPAVDWVTDARELIGADSYQSVSLAVHAMLGAVLYGVARAVIDDGIGITSSLQTAQRRISEMMADHRARLQIPDGNHALTPPYQWTLAYTIDNTSRVHVEART
jgi:hypothetical protein